MYGRLLVPLDGSSVVDSALRYATAIAQRTGAVIELVHVHQHYQDPMALESLTPYRYEGITEFEESVDGRNWRDEQALLEELAGMLRRDFGFRVGARVIRGPMRDAVVLYAREIDADLLILGTTAHGQGTIAQGWLESTTHHVVRHATVPVLLMPRQTPGAPGDEVAPRFEHVPVPLDGSPWSEESLHFGGVLGQSFGSRLTLLRALGDHEPLLNLLGAQVRATSQRDQARSALQAVAARVRRSWTSADVVVAEHRSAAAAILATAATVGADLIAMATHGRSGLPRVVIGSVADEVLRNSTLPLFLVGPAAVRHHRSMARTTSPAIPAMTV